MTMLEFIQSFERGEFQLSGDELNEDCNQGAAALRFIQDNTGMTLRGFVNCYKHGFNGLYLFINCDGYFHFTPSRIQTLPVKSVFSFEDCHFTTEQELTTYITTHNVTLYVDDLRKRAPWMLDTVRDYSASTIERLLLIEAIEPIRVQVHAQRKYGIFEWRTCRADSIGNYPLLTLDACYKPEYALCISDAEVEAILL